MLVVDDEPIIRRTIARVLRRSDISVMVAPDGQAALAVLNQYAIDVVLLDLSMPRMGGEELLMRIKEGRIDVEVVIMTAYADDETVKRVRESGAFYFLLKPFRSFSEVVLIVERAADYRRLFKRSTEA